MGFLAACNLEVRITCKTVEVTIVQNSHKIKIIYSHTGVKHFYTRKRGARPFPEHADDWFDLQNFSFLAFCIVGRTNDFVQIISPL